MINLQGYYSITTVPLPGASPSTTLGPSPQQYIEDVQTARSAAFAPLVSVSVP